MDRLLLADTNSADQLREEGNCMLQLVVNADDGAWRCSVLEQQHGCSAEDR